MYYPLLFEFLGTLIFFYVIVNIGQPIPVAAAFLGAVFFSVAVSGAHLNPGVSFMMWLLNKMSSVQMLQYILVQCVAAATVVLMSQTKPA